MADEQTAVKDKPRRPKGGPNAAPFTVEFDAPRNRSVSIATLSVHRIRGAYANRKTRGHGALLGPGISSMPDIPGMRMTVKPGELSAELWDPLEDDPKLLREINARKRDVVAIRDDAEWTAVERQEFKLNPDQLKTLVLELRSLEESGEVAVVKGSIPTEEAVDLWPGRQLYDPWNSGRKPKYVEEVDEWHERLDREGG